MGGAWQHWPQSVHSHSINAGGWVWVHGRAGRPLCGCIQKTPSIQLIGYKLYPSPLRLVTMAYFTLHRPLAVPAADIPSMYLQWTRQVRS
jgi:hypothetical protein